MPQLLSDEHSICPSIHTFQRLNESVILSVSIVSSTAVVWGWINSRRVDRWAGWWVGLNWRWRNEREGLARGTRSTRSAWNSGKRDDRTSWKSWIRATWNSWKSDLACG